MERLKVWRQGLGVGYWAWYCEQRCGCDGCQWWNRYEHGEYVGYNY